MDVTEYNFFLLNEEKNIYSSFQKEISVEFVVLLLQIFYTQNVIVTQVPVL